MIQNVYYQDFYNLYLGDLDDGERYLKSMPREIDEDYQARIERTA